MILIDINNYDIIYNNPRDLVFVTSDMIMNYYMLFMIMLKIITRSYHISLFSLLKMVIVNFKISSMIEYVFHVFL